MSNIYHVHPINDLHEHELGSWDRSIVNLPPSCPCPCEPRVITEENGYIIVHNSFDGREGVEWAKEILNEL
jgi:hypothetical protein